jgi:hypothetical protein
VLDGLDMDEDMSPNPLSLPNEDKDPPKDMDRSLARCSASIHSFTENLASADADFGSSKV